MLSAHGMCPEEDDCYFEAPSEAPAPASQATMPKPQKASKDDLTNCIAVSQIKYITVYNYKYILYDLYILLYT